MEAEKQHLTNKNKITGREMMFIGKQSRVYPSVWHGKFVVFTSIIRSGMPGKKERMEIT